LVVNFIIQIQGYKLNIGINNNNINTILFILLLMKPHVGHLEVFGPSLFGISTVRDHPINAILFTFRDWFQ
jgi:hypothetical protein